MTFQKADLIKLLLILNLKVKRFFLNSFKSLIYFIQFNIFYLILSIWRIMR